MLLRLTCSDVCFLSFTTFPSLIYFISIFTNSLVQLHHFQISSVKIRRRNSTTKRAADFLIG